MPYNFVKIGKSGMPYFYDFDMDTCETSPTLCTRFTRNQIERLLRNICIGMVSVKRSISDISLDKNLSLSSPELLTTDIRKKSVPDGLM